MSYPSLVLKNQFGEESNNFVIGGSSEIWCNFIVDSTNGNGLGIRSLKGSGVANVFMHTSATPLGGNPNPASGYVLIQLSQPYAGYMGGTFGAVSPVSGTPIAVTVGTNVGWAYVITAVGTTSLSGWQSLGLPVGVVPAVGVSFVATSTTTTTGTGYIEVPTASGVDHVEVIGNPNLTSNVSTGALLLCQYLFEGSATAPADGSVIGLTFEMIPVPGPVI